MNQIALDNFLASALTEMSVADWPAAQKILASRLEQIRDLGNQRLNLFLLSISAASGGYQDVANQLWSQAQQVPVEPNVVRYFDLQFPSNDPRQSMLIDLERAWWDFNNWNQTGTLSLALEKAEQAIDWDYVVEATLDGRDAGIEERYGQEFDSCSSDGIFLWNLLALAYLEAGDVRTYDEMVQTAPPLPPPNSVPADLALALSSRNLNSALAVLQQGQWLTTASLSPTVDTEPISEPETNLTEAEWVQQMIEGFAFIGLGQSLEASRTFQEINFRTEPSQRLVVSRNALALAFFKQGDYTQCENVYEEFRNLLAQFPISPNSELAQEYKKWLESVESAPDDGQPFFSPFDGTRSTWNEAPVEEIDFWEEFQAIVGLLGQGDHVKALAKLQKTEISLGSNLDTFQKYLLSVMFLAGFVMAGDHSEVQELAPQIAYLETAAIFPEHRLEDLGDTLRWAGFEDFYTRLTGGPQARVKPLNPWNDLTIQP